MAEPLSFTASIIAVLQLTQSVLSVCYDYSAALKGSSWELTKVKDELQGFRTVLQALEPLMREAESSSPTPNARLPTLDALCTPGGALQSCLADLEYLEKKLKGPAWSDEFGPRRKALLQSLRWPLQEADTRRILERLARFRSTLALALNVDDTKLMLAIHNLGLQTNEDVHGLKDVVERARNKADLERLEEEKRLIQGWLSAPDPSINHNRAQQSHHVETGSWFLGSDEFKRWKRQRIVTWLYGIPGCGKTILASTIIEAIREGYGSANDTAVLYFYFDFNDLQKQKLAFMVRSLLSQILECSSVAFRRLKSLYDLCSDGKSQPNLKSLCVKLAEIVENVDETFIVFDALDECGEREELFGIINQVRQYNPQKTHMLVTSRRLPDIEETLSPLVAEMDRIRVGGAPVDSDILAYINERLQSDQGLKRWRRLPEVQAEIRSTLTEKADGMYIPPKSRRVSRKSCLHYQVSLDSLPAGCPANCTRLPALRKALRNLPKTLDETYSRILCSIPDECADDAFNMLQWLTYSVQPLLVTELAEVVAINIDGEPWFDPEARFPEPSEVLSILSSLVTIEEAPIKSDKGHVQQRVRFAHFSVQEYLVSDRILNQKAKRFAIQKSLATQYIAEATCAYLFHIGKCLSEHGQSESKPKFPLSAYATAQWVHHLLLLEKKRISCELLLKLLLKIQELEIISSYSFYIGIFKAVCQFPVNHPLGFAAWAGIPDLVQTLLKEGHDINAQSLLWGSALHAALLGHADENLLRLLLAEGSDVNARCEQLRRPTALQIAARRSNKPAIELLLQYGADVNAHSEEGPALHDACNLCDLEIARLLLQRGADANTYNKRYDKYPLAVVFTGGMGRKAEPLIELLLEHGADINVVSESSGSALQVALRRDDSIIVALLLKRGAGVNAISERHSTALDTAIRYGRESQVQRLLEYGADVNAILPDGSTAICLACLCGGMEIVQLLLHWGADVHYNGGNGDMTPLQTACYGGYESLVELLLHMRVSVNLVGGVYGTALQAAVAGYVCHGQMSIIKMLLKAGADVNLQAGRHCTALQAAVARNSPHPYQRKDNSQLIQFLLAKKADVNIRGGQCGSALLAAASKYWVEVVGLLLKEGATVTPQEILELKFEERFSRRIDSRECSAEIRRLLEDALAL
ncbi:MAG: hypothetical protein Q9226_006457 [Calogaya cf. arnoldii]